MSIFVEISEAEARDLRDSWMRQLLRIEEQINYLRRDIAGIDAQLSAAPLPDESTLPTIEEVQEIVTARHASQNPNPTDSNL